MITTTQDLTVFFCIVQIFPSTQTEKSKIARYANFAAASVSRAVVVDVFLEA